MSIKYKILNFDRNLQLYIIMKKALLTVCGISLCLLGNLSANAQVAITPDKAPLENDAYVMKYFSAKTFMFTKNGAGQSWDFSDLPVSDKADTTIFINPSKTPGAAGMSQAVMSSTTSGSKEYNYYDLAGADLRILGVYSDPLKNGQMRNLYINPPMVVLSFPYTINSKINGTGDVIVVLKGTEVGQSGMDSVRSKHSIMNNFAVIGHGTLKTPAGTYPNSLIERQIQSTVDSTWAKGSLTQGKWMLIKQPENSTDSTFNFYDGSSFLPAATIEYQENSAVITSMSYMAKKMVIVNGIKNPSVNNVASVYPMPFASETNFTFAAPAKDQNGYTLSIYELTGKLAHQENAIKGDSFVYHNTSLSQGIYIYRLTDGRANVSTGKIVITE